MEYLFLSVAAEDYVTSQTLSEGVDEEGVLASFEAGGEEVLKAVALGLEKVGEAGTLQEFRDAFFKL